MKHTNPSTESLSRACPRVVQFHFHTLCSTWWTCSFLKQQCLSSTLSLHVIPRHSPVTPGRPALYTTTRSEFGRTTPGRLFILVFMQKGRIFCFVSFGNVRPCSALLHFLYHITCIHDPFLQILYPTTSLPIPRGANLQIQEFATCLHFFLSPRKERSVVLLSLACVVLKVLISWCVQHLPAEFRGM